MQHATKLPSLITTNMMQLDGLCLAGPAQSRSYYVVQPVHAAGWQPYLVSLCPPFISVTGVIRCLIIDNSSQAGNHLFHSLLVVRLT